MQIFDKLFNFYFKPEFPWKVLEICFTYFIQINLLDFLVLFPLSEKKRLQNKSFEVLGIEKEYDTKIQLIA